MNILIIPTFAATCREEFGLPKQSLRHPLRQLCCLFVQLFTCEARVQQTAYMRNDCLVQVHITPLRYQPICRRRNIFPDPTCEACFRQSSCEHCIQTLMCGGHPKGWSDSANYGASESPPAAHPPSTRRTAFRHGCVLFCPAGRK